MAASSSSSSSLDMNNVDDWVKEVMAKSHGAETIPFTILEPNILPPGSADLLIKTHIDNLLKTNSIANWMTTKSDGEILLCMVRKDENKMLCFKYSRETVLTDNIHDFNKLRKLAKKHTDGKPSDVEAKLEDAEEAMLLTVDDDNAADDYAGGDDSLESKSQNILTIQTGLTMIQKTFAKPFDKNRVHDKIARLFSLMPKVASNVHSIEVNYPPELLTEIQKIKKAKKEAEADLKFKKQSDTTGEIEQLKKKLKDAQSKEEMLVNILRRDAITAILGGQTVVDKITKWNADAKAGNTLNATRLETLKYYWDNQVGKEPPLVRLESDFLIPGLTLQANSLQNTKDREDRITSAIDKLPSAVPVVDSQTSTASSMADSTAKFHHGPGGGFLTWDPEPFKSAAAGRPASMPQAVTHTFPVIDEKELNMVPFLIEYIVDKGTPKSKGGVLQELLLNDDDTANFSDVYDQGGISTKKAPPNPSNMLAVAILREEQTLYIVTVEPRTVGSNLGNYVSLYTAVLNGKAVVENVTLTKRYSPTGNFSSNVNNLALMVGGGEFNPNFARVSKFIADRLILSWLLLLPDPMTILVVTHDTYAGESIALSTIIYQDMDGNVGEKHVVIPTVITTMFPNKCVFRALVKNVSGKESQTIQAKLTALEEEKTQLAYQAKKVAAEARAAAARKAAEAAVERAEAAERARVEAVNKTMTTRERLATKREAARKAAEEEERTAAAANIAMDNADKSIEYREWMDAEAVVAAMEAAEDIKGALAEGALAEGALAEGALAEEAEEAEEAMEAEEAEEAMDEEGEDGAKKRVMKRPAAHNMTDTSSSKSRKREGGSNKSKKSRKSRKPKKSRKSRKSRKVKKSKKSRKVNKSRKQSQYKSLFGKTLKRHTKTI